MQAEIKTYEISQADLSITRNCYGDVVEHKAIGFSRSYYGYEQEEMIALFIASFQNWLNSSGEPVKLIFVTEQEKDERLRAEIAAIVTEKFDFDEIVENIFNEIKGAK